MRSGSRSHTAFIHILSTVAVAIALLFSGPAPRGQSTPPSFTVIAKEGRRPLPTTLDGSVELVALDDLAALLQLTVREQSGAVAVSFRTQTTVLTPSQTIASVAGRLVSLSAPPRQIAGRWYVPLDFIVRGVAPILDTRVDLRRASRLLIVGDMRVSRLTIRHEPLPNAARVTLDATPPAASTLTQEDGRLTLRFDADAIDGIIPAIQPTAGVLQAIRQVDPVTVVLELGPRFAAYKASNQTAENTTRVIVDLAAAAPAVTAAAPAAPAPAPAAPPAALPPDLAGFGSTPTAIRTIAVDPGHGGDDVGAKGAEGTLEKDVTLAVARRLKGTLESRLGIHVLLTRDDDRAVPLNQRVAIANNNKADLFLSLHANGSVQTSALGASIYVAQLEDAENGRPVLVPERVPVFGGGARDIELVPWELAQVRYVDQSAAMARLLREQFQLRIALDVRPVDRAPLRVLAAANMPAVLIEMGYLTNAEQEKQLAGAELPDCDRAEHRRRHPALPRSPDGSGGER